jgi:hypothetical protein
MGTAAMAFLAASVALGYFTIAAVVAPRIKMPSAGRQVVVAIRGAAIAFFVGCGMTHVHIFLHTLGVGTPQPVEEQRWLADETGTQQAQAVAQRFVASLHDTSVDGTLRTSVSAGVASIEGTLSPAEMMKRVDIALYQAKRAGGDRYAMSEPVPQPQSA